MDLTASEKYFPPEVIRYISKYGMKGWSCEAASLDGISTAVIIPAIMEYDNIASLLDSLSGNSPEYFNETLVIFVVNNTGEAGQQVKNENAETLRFLRSIIYPERQRIEQNGSSVKESIPGESKTKDLKVTGSIKEDPAAEYLFQKYPDIIKKVLSSGLRLALVDASSEGRELPVKDGGVGFARKIGMDLALTIFDYHSRHTPVLVCLDADCTVEKNYITEIRRFFSEGNQLTAAQLTAAQLPIRSTSGKITSVNGTRQKSAQHQSKKGECINAAVVNYIHTSPYGSLNGYSTSDQTHSLKCMCVSESNDNPSGMESRAKESRGMESALAIINYEIFLRYYVLGLKFASSPFAFHTIGSTMICDFSSYIKIEGMNKRKAAEDFYFMEKLAKSYRIHSIKTTAVYPSPRGSWRVPFGTGQRVNRFLSHERDEYYLYSPRSFSVLKDWLLLFNYGEQEDSSILIKEAEKIHPALSSFLRENNFEESWKKIVANSRNKEQVRKQKLFWFDGFRTLKLIHYLRDKAIPQEPMFDALDVMLAHFCQGVQRENKKGELPGIDTQMEYLRLLRKLA